MSFEAFFRSGFLSACQTKQAKTVATLINEERRARLLVGNPRPSQMHVNTLTTTLSRRPEGNRSLRTSNAPHLAGHGRRGAITHSHLRWHLSFGAHGRAYHRSSGWVAAASNGAVRRPVCSEYCTHDESLELRASGRDGSLCSSTRRFRWKWARAWAAHVVKARDRSNPLRLRNHQRGYTRTVDNARHSFDCRRARTRAGLPEGTSRQDGRITIDIPWNTISCCALSEPKV